MIRPDLPVVSLADLPGGPDPVVLCATARLAVDLRRAHGELQQARGEVTWRALQCSTPMQWLDMLVSRALLSGEVPPDAAAGGFLGRAQERNLWEQAIAIDAGAAAELFDREGMALAAMEAASLQRSWRIEVPEALHTSEYEAFLRWGEAFAASCRDGGWRGRDEVLAWRVACIERGLGGLPARIGLAGFVMPDPLVSRLLLVLEGCGVELVRVDFSHAAAGAARGVECPDAEAECLAAASWARARLAAAGARAPRLRIAAADLPARRHLLEAALASVLQGDAVGAGWAAQESDYAFVAGTPLAAQPLVATALGLLQIYAGPRRIAQAEFGALLCAPGWSADIDEADARARIEAGLRELLPPEAGLERYRLAIGRLLAGERGLQAPYLAAQLDALQDAARAATRRQPASAWAASFATVLDALGWPGQRPLLAAEAAAVDALRELIANLQSLDAVLGRIDRAEALRQLRRQCRDTTFHAPRRNAPRVEVCGLDDALAGAVDGLWVMGVNEGEWPPAPRPNPLLPADLQRRAGIPAARADSLAAAAREQQALWCASAAEVVFSWARQQGERALRPSPLLAGIAVEVMEALEVGDGERIPAAAIERLIDARAPVVAPGESVRGGTGLLAAQATCPAWAFHQYRLGAAVLPAPTFGLDAMARGSLLHAALEAFWRGRGLAELRAMEGHAREAEITRVVAVALDEYDREAVAPLAPRLRGLEAQRLAELLATWLEVEATRGEFRVLSCEESQRLDIEGLAIRVVVDRVDQLGDGRLAIIDYKSGRSDRSKTWADARITEPQLPIYAALAFPDRAVAAVALARVTREDPAFLGVAEEAGLLPGVDALDGQRRRYASADFPDWPALRACWAERIREIAREVKDGIAAVVFEDEKALQYCEVKPLLRLAERKLQLDEERG
ncbi:MAG: PD-(D/E)XK nuclease family protein [Rhodocyclales bacterium]|nr:PD-(D/E)XK nuclease family protein [Rhodocyclales bacterium]